MGVNGKNLRADNTFALEFARGLYSRSSSSNACKARTKREWEINIYKNQALSVSVQLTKKLMGVTKRGHRMNYIDVHIHIHMCV